MKNRIRRSLHLIEKGVDAIKNAFFNRKGYDKNVQLIAYYGHGNDNLINFEGRVLKEVNISATKKNDSIFKNIMRMYKHFGSMELAGVHITAKYGDEIRYATTDEEGYYCFEFPFKSVADKKKLWHKIEVSISVDQKFEAHQTAWVQVPIPSTSFGIISDIDDTIIKTGASNLLSALKTTFTKNADTRLPFNGVKALYKGLQNGLEDYPVNPIFYLSNSPWNLYDFLNEFMELKDIPRGSLYLRDWGLDDVKLFVDDNHKLNTIKRMLTTYPKLSFILIGDSGEKDPEYYSTIVKQFPDRILAVYIRDVSDSKRDLEVKAIKKDVEDLGVPMYLMEDSFVAAEHAERMQWITSEQKELVREEVWS